MHALPQPPHVQFPRTHCAKFVYSTASPPREATCCASPMNHRRPRAIAIIAVLMVLFGSAEVVTGFTHNFLGLISTTNNSLATYGAAGVGALYAAGGFLLLNMTKRAAALALACLIAIVLGRVALVSTGLYPLNSFLQIFSMAVGNLIAVGFATYIAAKWHSCPASTRKAPRKRKPRPYKSSPPSKSCNRAARSPHHHHRDRRSFSSPPAETCRWRRSRRA